MSFLILDVSATLVGSNSPFSGRLELEFDGVKESVYSSSWEAHDGTSFCRLATIIASEWIYKQFNLNLNLTVIKMVKWPRIMNHCVVS